MTDPTLERDLERLREEYRAKLPEQLSGLEALLRGARDQEPGGDRGREQLEVARNLAHRLRGTAGSYGFGATSSALGRIEESVAQLLEEAQPDPESVWNEVEGAVAQARVRIESL